MDIDIVILFAYLALVFSIGFMFNSRTKDVKNYFADSREPMQLLRHWQFFGRCFLWI